MAQYYHLKLMYFLFSTFLSGVLTFFELATFTLWADEPPHIICFATMFKAGRGRHSYTGTQPWSFDYILSVVGFMSQQQRYVVVTETTWLAKLKIFTLYPFTEKVCPPLYYNRYLKIHACAYVCVSCPGVFKTHLSSKHTAAISALTRW